MTGRVEGKVAFISGAARGQGRAHAVRLAQEGADIIAIDICKKIDTVDLIAASTPEDLAETADLVKGHNRRIVTAEVDVRLRRIEGGGGQRRRAVGPPRHHRGERRYRQRRPDAG
jgi:NAD(P)-dependent dehydrogenase (short-subunit alcohol dehydrogenase family)